MAQTPKTISKDQRPQDVELAHDAWPRFEQFVKTAAKAGPQHREPPKTAKRASAKKRAPSA
jgi:hypothetical protein